MPVAHRPRSSSTRSCVVAGALVGQAVRALARRKGRTVLAALSIASGIVAVVWVVAIGRAGARRAEAQLAALGDGLVYVSAGSRNVGGVRTGSHGAVTLTAEDAEAILAELPRIASVAVMTETSVSIVSAMGGIGIMNMMLASVAERTREIGLRLSVGASERAVQAQFLLESVMLSSFGGVAGVAASAAGPYMAERVLGWEVAIPIQAVLLALGFSVTVGVSFGFYPAWNASRLDPITALRED